MFIAFGLFFAIGARNYQIGSAARMGPAYFPTMLGGLMSVIGGVVLLRSLIVSGGKVSRYPFRLVFIVTLALLVFGYSLFYWHKNVLVQHSETLKREYQILLMDYPEGFVDINVDDANKLGIKDGARIRLVSERGSAGTYARVTNEVKAGMVFVPYFLQDIALSVLGEAGILDFSVSGQVYVRVEKA